MNAAQGDRPAPLLAQLGFVPLLSSRLLAHESTIIDRLCFLCPRQERCIGSRGPSPVTSVCGPDQALVLAAQTLSSRYRVDIIESFPRCTPPFSKGQLRRLWCRRPTTTIPRRFDAAKVTVGSLCECLHFPFRIQIARPPMALFYLQVPKSGPRPPPPPSIVPAIPPGSFAIGSRSPPT